MKTASMPKDDSLSNRAVRTQNTALFPLGGPDWTWTLSCALRLPFGLNAASVSLNYSLISPLTICEIRVRKTLIFYRLLIGDSAVMQLLDIYQCETQSRVKSWSLAVLVAIRVFIFIDDMKAFLHHKSLWDDLLKQHNEVFCVLKTTPH